MALYDTDYNVEMACLKRLEAADAGEGDSWASVEKPKKKERDEKSLVRASSKNKGGNMCGYNTGIMCGYKPNHSKKNCAGMTTIRPITRKFFARKFFTRKFSDLHKRSFLRI